MSMLLGAAAQEVTAWPQRLALTAAVLAVTLLAVWGMWRSWQRRAGEELPMPAVPEGFQADLAVPGRYVGTSPAADWMARVVAGGLGAPGNATAGVGRAGVRLERIGEPTVFLPADSITDVLLGRGVGGQVAEKDGLVLWFWRAGDKPLQTGFRPDTATDVVHLYQASRELFAGEESR
ncbi:MAG TPA: transporter [Actinomycetota bacterium]|nr:transporter [Actinomycetota bacterium]